MVVLIEVGSIKNFEGKIMNLVLDKFSLRVVFHILLWVTGNFGLKIGRKVRTEYVNSRDQQRILKP